MQKVCMECKIPIKGRTDKKFCSDDCRAIHHNRLRKDVNRMMRNINNTLRRNRRILEDLKSKGLNKIWRDQLLESGFNFNFFTNEYQSNSGHIYRFCYEYGYGVISENLYTVVQREYPANPINVNIGILQNIDSLQT